MGEFGPGFTGGGGLSVDTPEAISADLFIPDPRSIVVEVPIVHDIADETANWHIQMEIGNVADPHFFVPLLQTDTTSDRMHWHYIPRMQGVPRTLQFFPTGGVATEKSKAVDMAGTVATALYVVGGDIVGIMQPRHMYFQRSRFSTDGGKHWSQWYSGVLKL